MTLFLFAFCLSHSHLFISKQSLSDGVFYFHNDVGWQGCPNEIKLTLNATLKKFLIKL